MPTIRVDFNVDDTTASLEALLVRLGPLLSPEPALEEPVVLDFEDCQYLGPAAIVFVFALLTRLSDAHAQWSFVPPRLSPLRAYCGFAGLLAHAGLGEPPTPGHPSNVTIPTRRFETYDMQGIDAVAALVRRFVPMSKDTESVLRLSISELMQNVLDHSSSKIGGFLSARAFQGEREVRFAIADFGVGVLSTLARRHAALRTNEAAVRAAFSERKTASTLARNQGLGLHALSEMARYNGGEVVLVSFDGAAEQHGSRSLTSRTLRAGFPGTMAIVRFKIDDALYQADSEPAEDLEV